MESGADAFWSRQSEQKWREDLISIKRKASSALGQMINKDGDVVYDKLDGNVYRFDGRKGEWVVTQEEEVETKVTAIGKPNILNSADASETGVGKKRKLVY